MSADAHHITAPHPEGTGAQRVMLEALKDANLKPEDIDYINVHGTSTPLGDVGEILAIKKVFGEHAYKLNISSTKSMTGHSLGGTGVQEAIYSLLMMENNFICASANIENLEPEADGLKIVLERKDNIQLNCIMSNSFGFGGTNASLVFERYQN